ncbi:MAG: hypothetical protein AABY10_02965, partial [Nanoarchaeota archaeon]
MQYLKLRNKFNNSLYYLTKKILFHYEPEKVHNNFIKIGKSLGSHKVSKEAASKLFSFENPALKQNLVGITFRNPVGLSAGFDKNAELVDLLPSIGFGFAEVGSITANPCKGNEGKRLVRLPEKKSIWVNLGLNNKGYLEIKNRIKSKKFEIPIGISVAKTNSAETVNPKIGLKDYLTTLKGMKKIGSYFTINISCPNAFGGQPFSSPELFKSLMNEIQKLKYQLSLIGGIDREVVEEYQQTKERFDFLSDQIKDLSTALADLEKMILELDDIMKKKRAASFKKIRKEFDRYVKILFGGGDGDIFEIYGEEKEEEEEEEYAELVEGEVAGELVEEKPKRKEKILTGIDISINPPGKKIKNISTLSGGERTLVSIALICAILSY